MDKTTFKFLWKDLERKKGQPFFARKLVVKNFDDFSKEVFYSNGKDKLRLVKSLYSGDIYLLKRAFSEKFCKEIIKGAWKINKERKGSFHKMKGKCPNFHRLIDDRVNKNYSYDHVKRAFYFFPFNKDPLNMFETIYKRWRVIKYVGGRKYNEFENNTTYDRVVDRFQVVQYPTGAGHFETHSDPYHNQRFFICGFLSKRGKNFSQGGLYCYKKDRSIVDAEKYIDTGDMLIGYATVLHGVSKIDPVKKVNFNSPRGRWFLGLYTNDTDNIKKRRSTVPRGKSFRGKSFPSPSLPLQQ